MQEGPTAVPGGGSVLDLVTQTGPVNQAVLALLLVLSVASWAIIIQKTWSYRTAERHTAAFLQAFRRSTKFAEVQAACPSVPASPLVGVFQAVIEFAGSQGTIAIRQQAQFTGASEGTWQVASGTGAYGGARGHGTFAFAAPNSLTFTGVISTAG